MDDDDDDHDDDDEPGVLWCKNDKNEESMRVLRAPLVGETCLLCLGASPSLGN